MVRRDNGGGDRDRHSRHAIHILYANTGAARGRRRVRKAAMRRGAGTKDAEWRKPLAKEKNFAWFKSKVKAGTSRGERVLQLVRQYVCTRPSKRQSERRRMAEALVWKNGSRDGGAVPRRENRTTTMMTKRRRVHVRRLRLRNANARETNNTS